MFNSPITHTKLTGNILEATELGIPRYNGQNLGSQWCPLLRGSTVCKNYESYIHCGGQWHIWKMLWNSIHKTITRKLTLPQPSIMHVWPTLYWCSISRRYTRLKVWSRLVKQDSHTKSGSGSARLSIHSKRWTQSCKTWLYICPAKLASVVIGSWVLQWSYFGNH